MDSRTLVGIVIMLGIYFYFLAPKPNHSPDPTVTSNAIALSPKTTAADTAIPAQSIQAPTNPTQDQKFAAQSFDLENSLMRMQINGLGQVQQIFFKKYFETPKKEKEVSLEFGDAVFNLQKLSVNSQLVSWKTIAKTENSLSLQSDASGAKITRKIQLDADAYTLSYSDKIENPGTTDLKARINFDIHRKALEVQPATNFFQKIFFPRAEIHEALQFVDGKASRSSLDSFKANSPATGLLTGVGYSDKYFYYGLVSKDFSLATAELQKLPDGHFNQSAASVEKTVTAKEDSSFTYTYYLGPKELPELRKTADELTDTVDYGSWLGPIARFLLKLLHIFYSFIPNYGVAIILVTILVNVVLSPLAYKSAISMRKLQMVAPKMKELKDRYKDDKVRLNTEIMNLYKTEKVNPIGGCLPLLIQMPVFFSFYRVFFASIELRQAPFLGWIHDLSHYDPFFITPGLLVVLMFFQQRLTPMPPPTEDNETARAQQAMMRWMPMIFGFIMVFLPAGLTVYYVTNSLIAILRQIYINRVLDERFPLVKKV